MIKGTGVFEHYAFIFILFFGIPATLGAQIYKLGLESAGFLSTVPVNAFGTKSNAHWDFSITPVVERIYHEYVEVGTGLGVSSLSQTLSTQKERFAYRATFLSLPLYAKLRSKMINYSRYFLRIGTAFHFKINEASHLTGTKTTIKDISGFGGAHICFFGGLGLEYSFMNGFEAQMGIDIQSRLSNPLAQKPAEVGNLHFLNFGFYFSLCYEFHRTHHGY